MTNFGNVTIAEKLNKVSFVSKDCLTLRRPESAIVDQRRETGIISEIYQFRLTHECCESENAARRECH